MPSPVEAPSTARYCALFEEREQLLNAFADHRGDRDRFADGSWYIRLATLEFELAFNTSNDDDVLHWMRCAYGRGVHEMVDLGVRSRAATRLAHVEARSYAYEGSVAAAAVL